MLSACVHLYFVLPVDVRGLRQVLVLLWFLHGIDKQYYSCPYTSKTVSVSMLDESGVPRDACHLAASCSAGTGT